MFFGRKNMPGIPCMKMYRASFTRPAMGTILWTFQFLLATIISEHLICDAQTIEGVATCVVRIRAPQEPIRIPVTIDGQVGWFILDTGSTRTVVSKDRFPTLRASGVFEECESGSGAFRLPQYTTRAVLIGGNIPSGLKTVLAMDMSGLSRSLGVGVDGILGCDAMVQCIITIDFDKSLLQIRSSPCVVESLQSERGRTVDLRPFVEVMVGSGKGARFVIDTGNMQTGSIDKLLLDDLSPSRDYRRTNTFVKIVGADNKIESCELVRIATLAIDKNMHSDLVFAPGPCSVLGIDFLARYKVNIDIKMRTVQLTPGNAFHSRDHGDYLGLAFEDDFGVELRVIDVSAGSDADTVGIRKGDVLIGLDGKPIKECDRREVFRRLVMCSSVPIGLTFQRGSDTVGVLVP